MATIKAVSSKASISTAIEYVTKEEKTEQKLQSGIGCNPLTAYDEMQATKETWNKTGGRQYKHYVQSFAPGETTPEQAQAIGRELAEKNKAWQGFEVIVVTHKDREHIHNHFIVNSVSYEDGHKIQDGPKDLERLKKQSDELCKREGLSVIDRNKPREAEESQAYNKNTYKILKDAEKGKVQSYVQDTAITIIEEKQEATSREDFINRMNKRGYSVDWQDSHKNITFTDKEREANGEKKCKVRNSTLEKYYNIDFSKEGLSYEFEENRAKTLRPAEAERGLAEQVEEAKRKLQPTNDRIDRSEKELAEVRQDRERTSQFATGSSRSGSGRAGITPDIEPETERRDREPERTANHIKEQPQNRSGIDAELERIRTELQGEAERERQKAERERSRTDEVTGEQQEVVAAADENTAEASRVGADQREVEQKQRSINEEQQNHRARTSGASEKAERVGTEQHDIKRKQREFGEQQSSISERIGELGDRVQQLAEKLKNIIKPFRRGGR